MSNSTQKVTKTNKALLALVIVGLLVGIGLLVLAKYMLTNYTYSLAQTHRSHVINVSGKIVLALSLVILVVCVIRLLMSKDPFAKTSNKNSP